jgi:peroxiredoxin Q/BCP
MLKIGDKLPEFELKNQDGKTIKSSELLGKKLVIFFYPKANTPTCTVEACNLSDHFLKLKNAGFQLLGISADSVKNQKNFHSKFSFNYDLIADENREIIEKFGVWQKKKNYGKEYMGIVRSTFIFDENGICTKVINKVQAKIATEQILNS